MMDTRKIDILKLVVNHYSPLVQAALERRRIIDQWEYEVSVILDTDTTCIQKWTSAIELAASKQEGYYNLFYSRFIHLSNYQFGTEAMARIRDRAARGEDVNTIQVWVDELPKRLIDELHLESVNQRFGCW